MKRFSLFALGLTLAMSLTGCFGGGGGDSLDNDIEPTPGSFSATYEGVIGNRTIEMLLVDTTLRGGDLDDVRGVAVIKNDGEVEALGPVEGYFELGDGLYLQFEGWDGQIE